MFDLASVLHWVAFQFASSFRMTHSALNMSINHRWRTLLQFQLKLQMNVNLINRNTRVERMDKVELKCCFFESSKSRTVISKY
jgi:hypothetical protein